MSQEEAEPPRLESTINNLAVIQRPPYSAHKEICGLIGKRSNDLLSNEIVFPFVCIALRLGCYRFVVVLKMRTKTRKELLCSMWALCV